GVRDHAPTDPRIHSDGLCQTDPAHVPRHRPSGAGYRDRPSSGDTVRCERPLPIAPRAGVRALRIRRHHGPACGCRACGAPRAERLAAAVSRLRLRGDADRVAAGAMNETLASFGLALAQLGVLLALAPGLNGLIKRVKAVLQGRKGPPLLQPYFD